MNDRNSSLILVLGLVAVAILAAAARGWLYGDPRCAFVQCRVVVEAP